MKPFTVAFGSILLAATSCEGVAFDGAGQHVVLFGIRGGSNKPATDEVDAKRAKNAIISAVTKVEDRVQKAVEREVDALFHKAPKHKKEEVVKKAKKAVERGAHKVKKTVDEHDHDVANHLPFEHHYPYEWPHANEEEPSSESGRGRKASKKGSGKKKVEKAQVGHQDSRILHAVEAAENALLHAVEDEVHNLFHEMEHHDDHEKEHAKKVVKAGVKKASKKTEDAHEHRRKWLEGETTSFIEDYIQMDFE